MEPLKLEDFLVIKKKSILEVSAMELGFDWTKVAKEDREILERLSKRYPDKKDFEDKLNALRALYSSVDILVEIGFEHDSIIERENLGRDKLLGKKAVIAVGGDNHLIWILDQLEYLGFDFPVIGFNSDLRRSVGGLLYDNNDTIKGTLRKCKDGNYKLEEWPKIDGEILSDQRVTLFSAAQEYMLGEYAKSQGSRWILKHNHREELQRGSCLLVANGAGSSGWHGGTHFNLLDKPGNFSRMSRELRYIIDNPFPNKYKYKALTGKIKDGEILEIISYNDNRGVADTDSIDEKRYLFDFPMGAIAKIWVSNKTSKIIKAL